MGNGRAALDGIRLHHSKTMRDSDVRRVGPLRYTVPERLLLDLAATVSSRMLEVALDSLLFQRLTTIQRIRTHLNEVRCSGLTGVRALATLLADRDPDQAPASSIFETDFYRFLKSSRHDYGARFQYDVFDGMGFVGRLDIAYPEQKVGIEVHSLRWHSPRERVKKDAARHNRLTAAGWRILYETYENLNSQPHEIARRLETLLYSSSSPAEP